MQGEKTSERGHMSTITSCSTTAVHKQPTEGKNRQCARSSPSAGKKKAGTLEEDQDPMSGESIAAVRNQTKVLSNSVYGRETSKREQQGL